MKVTIFSSRGKQFVDIVDTVPPSDIRSPSQAKAEGYSPDMSTHILRTPAMLFNVANLQNAIWGMGKKIWILVENKKAYGIWKSAQQDKKN